MGIKITHKYKNILVLALIKIESVYIYSHQKIFIIMHLWRFVFLYLFYIITFSGENVFAQDINTTQLPVQLTILPKAIINLATSETDTTNFRKTEQILSPTSNNTSWINYSSVVEKNTTNSICASLSSSNLPVEIIVEMHITEDAGEGSGKKGIPAGPILPLPYVPLPHL